MRIISGQFKGKQLIAPKNLPVRPTTDFAKEGLFNILNHKIEFDGLTVLDLFCGTGNISFEFASRGAKKINAIDKHSPCLNFVRDTAKMLKLTSIYTERADVFKYLDKLQSKFDVIFADPPYELENIPALYDLVFAHDLLNEGGLLIIEHGPKTLFADKAFFTETRKYGNVNFSFFEKPTD